VAALGALALALPCPCPALFVTTDRQTPQGTEGTDNDWKNLPGTAHTDI